jgi:hypothetical protein
MTDLSLISKGGREHIFLIYSVTDSVSRNVTISSHSNIFYSDNSLAHKPMLSIRFAASLCVSCRRDRLPNL